MKVQCVFERLCGSWSWAGVSTTLLCGLCVTAVSTGSAQTPAPTAAPVKRQPLMAPIPTPPGYKGPKVEQFRGFVQATPTKAAAQPVVAKAAVKLPKALELSAKAKPGQKAVHMTWKADARATTLTLERAESETGPFSAVAILGSSEGSFDDENSIVAGTTYYYRMISSFEGYDGGLVSPVSSPVMVLADKPEGTNLDGNTTASAPVEHTGMILPSHAEKSSEAAHADGKKKAAKKSDAATTAGR